MSIATGIRCGAVTLAFTLAAWTQSKPPTVLDGVYSEQQAQSGKMQYEAICAGCHDIDEPEAPPPKGPDFIDRWREAPLGFLHNFIRTSMPGDKPGSLSAESYLDVVAYLLEANGYPAGNSPLTAARANEVLLVGPNGPAPLPANALVLAVGCLLNKGGAWTLESAANPSRVRVADETSADELAASRQAALGSATYMLRNADDFPAEKMTGQKVQAKGVLSKASAPFTLSVLSLEALGEACAK